MLRLTTDECKKISLDILIDVANFCEKNKITYFLACGTLLGAIRHKGYIPWDDDIDIMMPRPDYNRFINEYNGKYRISKPNEGRFYYTKVYDNNTVKYEEDVDKKKYKPIGVDIDIFPLDGIVNDKKIIEKLYRKACFLEMILRLSNQPIFYRKNPLKAIPRIVARMIGSRKIIKLIEKNAQTYDYDTSSYVIRMRRSTNGFTGAHKKEIYDKTYAEFENHTFAIPKGYDEWLKTFYGDYMKLPQENDRKVHEMECFKVK